MKKSSIYSSIFLLISTLLFSTRYICAAIGASKDNTWSVDVFNVYLTNVPVILLILSVISLLIGLLFMAWSFIENKKK